jgi:hypothetical protein
MNQYIITEEQKTPDDPLNYATMAILARIGKQVEFKEAWEKLENAERNYICGDIYNIVKSACSHPYQSERDKVLDELIEWVRLYRIEIAPHITHSNFYHCNRFHKQLLELRQAGES